MQIISKFIPTLLAQLVETKKWVRQKGRGSKVHLTVDANGMPVRFFVTAGTTVDCAVAAKLIENFDAEYLLADCGYDTDAIVDAAEDTGMIVVIPPKKNRKQQRKYDRYIYKLRHLVENVFLDLKIWRDIATRYAKDSCSFIVAVQIRCISLCLNNY